MKKILLATSILAASAGFAAAEVAVSGSARMGVVYQDEINFSSRVRVAFSMSGESDTGLSFGASIRADNSGLGNDGAAGSVFVAVGGHKLEMGDVVGATEALLGDLYEVGYTDIGNNDIPYITGDSTDIMGLATVITAVDNPVALYTYNAGALHVAASFSDGFVADTAVDDRAEYALAVGYTMGAWTVGLGYEVAETAPGAAKAKMLEIGAAGTVGAANIKMYYADGSGAAAGVKAYGLSADTTFGATTVGAFYQNIDTGTDTAYYGLGMSYDLGGGAALKAGIADNDAAGTDPVADLGITMKF